jgi:hypothetical protein
VTGAAEDRFLAVQRQVVSVLGHQHLRQQPGGGDALVDDVRIDRRLVSVSHFAQAHLPRMWRSTVNTPGT